MKYSKRQRTALYLPCSEPKDFLRPEFRKCFGLLSTILSIDMDEWTLTTYGRPVWHAWVSVLNAQRTSPLPIRQWTKENSKQAAALFDMMLEDVGQPAQQRLLFGRGEMDGVVVDVSMDVRRLVNDQEMELLGVI